MPAAESGAPLAPLAFVDRLPPPLRRATTTVGPALAILVLQLVVWPVPAGVFARGVVVGLLGALVAVGMALIYRSNRILNFAQADLGSIPTTIAVLLITLSGLPYLLGLGIGLGAAVILGLVVELGVIRRFSHSPRLILTVATIGLTQLLVVGGLILAPWWWDTRPTTLRLQPPFDFRVDIDPIVFSANDLLAVILAPLAMVAIAVFLRYTAAGVAVRAAAERRDRAALLGIPVGRLQTIVWVIATVLAFLALYLRAGVLGLPFGFAGSFNVLLAAFAALMLGRMVNLPAIALASVSLGVLELAIDWNADSPLLIQPILALVIVVTLLLRRQSTSRVDADEVSSWQSVGEDRAIPPELAHLPEVQWVRWGIGAVIAVAVLALPLFLGAEDSLKISAVIIFALVGVSIVVLTGWAGQVSLGQMSFAAVGAVVAAKATSEWGWDLLLALVAAGLAGGVVALLVGLPALRLRGLYLAVTTLGFSLATWSYLLNPDVFDWIPDANQRIDRPPLLGRIDFDSPTGIYYVALAVFVVMVWVVAGLRRSRTGRVLMALRENERAAQSFGVSIVRAKLTAFATSGFVAAVAGGLLVHHQQVFSTNLYGTPESFAVFTASVVGGVGSVLGAVLGAVFLRGSQWLLPAERWQALASAAGVLLVLMILPGGLASLWTRVRDQYLRKVAERRGIVVPSLVADAAVDSPELAETRAATGAAALEAELATARRAAGADDGATNGSNGANGENVGPSGGARPGDPAANEPAHADGGAS
jgi:branched-chain amino acid transport system permease protein